MKLVQARVEPAVVQQLLMRSLFVQFAVVQHDDAVGILHGGEAVGDDEGRPPAKQLVRGRLDARLEFGRTEDIMRFGLHEYLVDFLERIYALASEITRRFFAPTA